MSRVNRKKLGICWKYGKILKPKHFRERKSLNNMWRKQSILWKNLKILWKSQKIRGKSGENPEKIRKPEKNPGENIIISDLISRLSIMWRNVVKTIEIWRFEKNHKKKVIFKLLSFAHEVKILKDLRSHAREKYVTA